VTDVRGDCKLHGVFVEALGGWRSPDPRAVFLARVRRDSVSTIRWAPWEQLAYPLCEPCHELGIEPGTPFRLALTASRSGLSVVQALGLCALQRVFLNEQSLAFVPLACATPFQHHGGQRGVFARASRERRITGRQKQEVIEIRTADADGAPIARQKDQRPGAEIFATFVTARLAGCDEDP
jgi:hypothetical protein